VIRVACVLLACATSAAVAKPDNAAMQAAFRAHNPGHWTQIDADGHGVIRHVRTDDPTIVDADVPTLRGALQIMRGDIGGVADERDPVSFPGGLAFMLFEDTGTTVIGLAVVHRQPKQLDIDVQLATLTVADGEKRLAGRSVRQTIQLGHGPAIDCKMGGGPCKTVVEKTIHRNVTIAREEVAGAMGVHAEKASARLVICVGAEHPVPDELADRGVVSNRLVSVPLVLDAVTGSQLAIPARDCNDPIITR
jgi:hypothetical protein